MKASVVTGAFYAFLAALAWGLVFVAPVMLPGWPPVLIAVCRYLAFGLVCLPMLAFDWAGFRALTASDWISAAKLSLVGNFVYYAALAAAVQRADAPMVSAIIGTIPVLVAIVSNKEKGGGATLIPWRKLGFSVLLIAVGLGLINFSEWRRVEVSRSGEYLTGILLAVVAVACWVWYPIKNARWIQQNSDKSPTTWATAQGLVTLPMALVALGMFFGIAQDTSFKGLPDTGLFLLLMLTMGLVSSWGASVCWNQASKRLPTAVAGQLIVLETVVAQVYGYMWRAEMPSLFAFGGVVLLVVGVLAALRGVGGGE